MLSWTVTVFIWSGYFPQQIIKNGNIFTTNYKTVSMERRHITLQRQVLVWFIALTRYLRDITYKMETKHDTVKIMKG